VILLSDRYNINDNDTIINQLVKVQAQVTVAPLVKYGKPKIYCIDIKPVSSCNLDKYWKIICPECRALEKSGGKCSSTFTQVLCIEIPFAFEVVVDIDNSVICCGETDCEIKTHTTKPLENNKVKFENFNKRLVFKQQK